MNDLFRDIETLSTIGKYNEWNVKLDRIWANLCYREDLDIVRDIDGNIIEMKLNQKDIQEKDFLDTKIKQAKRRMNMAKKECQTKGEEYLKNKYFKFNKDELNRLLLIKDIWIRKLMHRHKLYIKEIKSNPAGAMWGK